MPGIEEVETGIGHVIEVGMCTRRNERRVTLAPDNQRGRLLFPQESLPLGIGFDVAPVVLKQLDLNLPLFIGLQESEVMSPVVGAHQKLSAFYIS
ncbi:hypothetical protein D3C81_1883570 [compost metagenome]